MHGRVNAHRLFVGVLGRDALVHLEQVAVALLDHAFAEALDRVGKIEVDAAPAGADAATLVADLFGRARRDVARRQIAVARVFAFEVIIALVFEDLVRAAAVAGLLRRPDSAVVAERFGHQRQLRLIIAAGGDAGRVDLRVAGVGEERALLERAVGRRHVAALRVGREEEDVAVAARGQHDGIRRVGLDFARHQVARDDPFGVAVDQNYVEHLGSRIHLHRAGVNLAAHRLVRPEQQLLPRLSARVKRARDLRAAERTVVQQPAVFARERHALRHALVDDVHADLGQAVNVGFTRAEVSALDRVVKQAVDRVAVVAVILRGVDAALRGDGVRAARAVLETKGLDVVAEFAQRGRRRSARQSRADDDDVEFAFIGRVDQFHLLPVFRPLHRDRPRRNLRIEYNAHNCYRYDTGSSGAPYLTKRNIMANGIKLFPIKSASAE